MNVEVDSIAWTDYQLMHFGNLLWAADEAYVWRCIGILLGPEDGRTPWYNERGLTLNIAVSSMYRAYHVTRTKPQNPSAVRLLLERT